SFAALAVGGGGFLAYKQFVPQGDPLVVAPPKENPEKELKVEKIVEPRKPPEKGEVAKVELEKKTGPQVLERIEVKGPAFKVIRDGDHLYAQVTGKPHLHLHEGDAVKLI